MAWNHRPQICDTCAPAVGSDDVGHQSLQNFHAGHKVVPTSLANLLFDGSHSREGTSAHAHVHFYHFDTQSALYMPAGANILLTASSEDSRGFTSKISDFGLSRLCTTNTEIETKTSGTVTHAPPELLSDGHLSQAGDVFAFGVMLWEMWNSQHAWSGLLPYQVGSGTPCKSFSGSKALMLCIVKTQGKCGSMAR